MLFQKLVLIAVGEARIAVIGRLVDCVTPTRQPIAVGDPDGFAGFVAGCPVALLIFGIAPASCIVPVPNLNAKFGSQPIREPMKGSGGEFF